MRKRIDIATDIATIGVWDPTCERHDLSSVKYADYQAGLESEAIAGRLFFINTGADGSYPAVIYIDELPAKELLEFYKTSGRQFLIQCQSGRLMAGGIEDYIHSKKWITSSDDEFLLAPGAYAIQVYELTEEKLIARMRSELGTDDYEYYAVRSERLPWGCLVFLTVVLTSVLLFAGHWLASLILFGFGLCFSLIRRRSLVTDHRFREIASRVDEINAGMPPFIYILRAVDEKSEINGGWYDLP